jgi:hypothetical protein
MILLLALMAAWATCQIEAQADNRKDFASLVSDEEFALADQCFELLRHHDFAALSEKLDPELRTPDLEATLNHMAKAIPQEEPVDSEIYRANVTTTTVTGSAATTRTTVLTLQYLFPKIWVVQEIALVNRGGGIVVTGFFIESSLESVESRNSLSWSTVLRKPAATLIIAAATVVVPVFILISVFFCIRTPIPQRKWLWIISSCWA